MRKCFQSFWYNCHTRLHHGLSAKLRIWQVPACRMEPQVFFFYLAWTPHTHPPTAKLFLSMLCGVLPPPNKVCAACGVPTPIRYVGCPHLNKVCAVFPPSSIRFFLCGVPPPLCHTWLCLGFEAKLRIWQVQACKMKPQIVFFYMLPQLNSQSISTCVSECENPN